MLKVFRAALVVTAAAWMLPLCGGKPAKYIFLLIADGTGCRMIDLHLRENPSSLFKMFKNRYKTEVLDATGIGGSAAACGTAISCGVQTKLCRMALDVNERPLKSLAYRLKEQGFKIGIITDSVITDATIAPFFAIASRCHEPEKVISALCRSGFDFFAAGRLSEGNSLPAEKVTESLISAGYRIVPGKKLRTMNPGERNVLLSLSRATKRQPGTPALGDITAGAAGLLSADGKGFLLVVSAGSIDYFNHRNDAASALREMQNFESVIDAALKFASRHPEETLIVITSDHESGELSITGKRATGFHLKQKYTYLEMSDRLVSLNQHKHTDERLIASALKMVHVKNVSDTEHRRLQIACRLFRAHRRLKRYGTYNPLVIEAMRLRDERNGVKYSTFGYTAKHIVTVVYGSGEEHFRSLKKNSDIPGCIAAAAGFPDLMTR